MVFLPIVERELRVAARRKGTYRVRLWTTVAALAVSLLFMLSFSLSGGQMPNLGRILFSILTYYAFVLSLLTGLLLAADCLSEEKREGTLGLLFLTDLKGYDIVLGKFMAVGLNALYGLIAVLPVAALPLLMGGVTGGEFWRVALALVNALFFALAAGMFVSSLSRDPIKAMSNTLGLLVLAVVIVPIVGWSLTQTSLPASSWYFTSFSPYYPFAYGFGGMTGNRYWISLLSSHLTGWLLLLLASWSLPRVWQDRPFRSKSVGKAGRGFQWHSTTRAVSPAVRSRMIDTNPILWLAGSDRSMLRRSWFVAIIGVGIIVTGMVLGTDISIGMAMTFTVNRIIGVVFKLLVAVHACRFFVEARRSGAMEMLLSSPLTGEEIVKGQWLAIKRIFQWPAVLLLTAQLFSLVVLAYFTILESNTGQAASMAIPLLMVAYRTGVFVMDIFALGWLGMWLGLSAKKPNFAPAMNILFVLVLPTFAFCVPDVFIDIFIIIWARAKMVNDFRRAALPLYGPIFYGLQSIPTVHDPSRPPVIGAQR